MVMLLFGCQDVIMQVLQHKVLLKNKFGKKKKRQDTTMAVKNSFRKYGTGKMNMEVESITNSKDMEFA